MRLLLRRAPAIHSASPLISLAVESATLRRALRARRSTGRKQSCADTIVSSSSDVCVGSGRVSEEASVNHWLHVGRATPSPAPRMRPRDEGAFSASTCTAAKCGGGGPRPVRGRGAGTSGRSGRGSCRPSIGSGSGRGSCRSPLVAAARRLCSRNFSWQRSSKRGPTSRCRCPGCRRCWDRSRGTESSAANG